MPTFALQERLCKSLIAERPTIVAGMKTVMAAIRAAPGGKPWADIPTPNWNDLEARWVEWFDQLLRDLPPPRPTELFWFEAPDFLNEPITSVSGYAKLDTTEEEFGLEEPRHWPIDPSGSTLLDGILNLPELDPLLAPLADDSADERVESCAYALTACITVLLVMNCLPKTRVLDAACVESIGVVTGWAEGGLEKVGKLSRDGWSPLRRTRPSKSQLGVPADDLIPPLYPSEFPKYLRAGGDPNRAHPEDGRTLLMNSSSERKPFIDKLIKAGARAEGRDLDGLEILHIFGARNLSVLDSLVSVGANPKAISGRFGESVLDRLLRCGLCTATHLDWCWKLGGRFHKHKKFPIHYLASNPGFRPEHQRNITAITHWLVENGYNLEARDAHGATPLWCSLTAHVQEMVSLRKTRVPKCPRPGTDVFGYDATAISMLNAGANPNARLKGRKLPSVPEGATPLMVGRYDNTNLVRALLAHGADPTLKCSSGKTALDFARAAAKRPKLFGHQAASQVVTILERAMAKAHRSPAKSSPRKPRP